MRFVKTVLALCAAAVVGGAALAQTAPQTQSPGPTPGMMGGYGMGQGMMGGHGGMMGPGGYGGMMGGYGGMMGPGMMGGYGGMMGPGMMSGYGGMVGHGMMGGALWALDLNDTQRAQILKIQDDARRKNWDLMGKSQDEMAKLRDTYLASGKLNRKAILDSYKRIDELRLQRIDNTLDAAEKIESVLTTQQRDQLKRWSPWWGADLGQ